MKTAQFWASILIPVAVLGIGVSFYFKKYFVIIEDLKRIQLENDTRVKIECFYIARDTEIKETYTAKYNIRIHLHEILILKNENTVSFTLKFENRSHPENLVDLRDDQWAIFDSGICYFKNNVRFMITKFTEGGKRKGKRQTNRRTLNV